MSCNRIALGNPEYPMRTCRGGYNGCLCSCHVEARKDELKKAKDIDLMEHCAELIDEVMT